MFQRLSGLTLALFASGVLTGAGCRDEAPHERYNANLGTKDRPLMPAPLPNLDPSILTGRASLVNVQEPVDAAEDQTEEQDREAIAGLVDAFREAYRQADYDALIPMLIEEQREIIRQTVPVSKDMRQAIDKLVAAVEDLNPTPPFYAQLAPMIERMTDVPLDVADLAFESDTQASLALASSNAVFKFRKTQDGWFIAIPNIEDVDVVTQQFTTTTAMMTSLTAVLEDSSLSPEERNAKIMSMLVGGGG